MRDDTKKNLRLLFKLLIVFIVIYGVWSFLQPEPQDPGTVCPVCGHDPSDTVDGVNFCSREDVSHKGTTIVYEPGSNKYWTLQEYEKLNTNKSKQAVKDYNNIKNPNYSELTYVCEDCGKSKSASEMYSIAGDVDGKTECKQCQAEDDKKALEGFNN